MILVGDTGGTKTNLAIYSIDDKAPKLEVESTFRSADFPTLDVIVKKFLNDTNITVDKAVLGVAGPIAKGKAQVTNLSWEISEATLKEIIQVEKMKLINDLEATAYAVPYLADHEVAPLNSERAERRFDANKAVIAPGTGLGEAFLVHHDDGYQIIPSEGGHSSFAPTTPVQLGLLQYMWRTHNHVSYERVCSGSMGIPHIYAYLSETRSEEGNKDVTAKIKTAKDPTPIIVNAALSGECELCLGVLNTFVSILGNEASNLAVKTMATGGIYLGGGIPPRILDKLKEGSFMAAFVNKGRFADMLSHIPVFAILNDKAALLGAFHYAMRL
ncbi:glucokinase [Anaerolineales bacterium HSG6]|nr:glucokinase [Anaerolineales bacterium HSG6]MDM8530567.1 glucokinase [Anaerolineales bacterium HSG25]